MNNFKLCSKCGEIKELNSFYARKGVKDGRESHCKDCNNKRNKLWAHNNPISINKMHEKKKLKNPEKYKKLNRNFAHKHRFRILAKRCNSDSKKKSGGELITATQLWSLAKKQKLCCAISGIKLNNSNLSVDHKLAFVNGGKNEIENLQLVDKRINWMKHALPTNEFLELIKTIYLFNFN